MRTVGSSYFTHVLRQRKRTRPTLFNCQSSSFSTGSNQSLWWPEAVEAIKQLPEIADAKETFSLGNYKEAESSLNRAKDICLSAFGADDPVTASVLMGMTKVYYYSGNVKGASAALSALNECKAVSSDSAKSEAVRIMYMKVMLDLGYDEETWSRLDLMQKRPYDTNCNELNSINCLVDLLWNPLLVHNNPDLFATFESWHDTHMAVVSRMENDPAQRACHLYNMGTSVWSKYLKNGLLLNTISEDAMSLLKEFTANSLTNTIDCLKEESTSLDEIMKVSEENANEVCALVSKENPDFARRIALTLNMLAVQNPKDKDSQLMLSKALALVQDLEDDGDEYRATLALILSSLARSLHLNGKALSSEGLYRSAIDKLATLRPRRNKYEVTSINILQNYAQLLHGWEKREADAASVAAEAQKLEEIYVSNCIGIELDQVVNWAHVASGCSFMDT